MKNLNYYVKKIYTYISFVCLKYFISSNFRSKHKQLYNMASYNIEDPHPWSGERWFIDVLYREMKQV